MKTAFRQFPSTMERNFRMAQGRSAINSSIPPYFHYAHFPDDFAQFEL